MTDVPGSLGKGRGLRGELRIVNRLPDGTVSPDGASIGFFGSTLPRAHAVSEDGSRVFFNTGSFGGAAADGSIVYFYSDANLTESSLTRGRPTLYRYEVESGELTDLTIAPDLPGGAWVQDTLALSVDGSHVYFSAVGDLTGEAPESPVDANLYHWHEGEIE